MTTADRERLIASLGLPADGDATRSYIEHGGGTAAPALATLVDAHVAERTWRRWQPGQPERLDQPGFRAAFEAMLAAGVAMGYALHRFESVCHDLPDPIAAPDRWTEVFERAIAGRNATDLRVHVHPTVREAFAASSAATDKDAERWDQLASMMADGLFYELGIILPRLELVADDSLAVTELRIEVNDAQLPRQPLIAADRALVNDTGDRLTLLDVKSEPAVNPANGVACATIAVADIERCKRAGLTTWSQMGHAILAISGTARGMAGGFVNRWLTEFYCAQLARAFPVIVAEVQRVMSTDAICQVLRALVDEEIAIRNLVRVFEVLALPEYVIAADPAKHILFPPKAVRRGQSYRVSDQLAPDFERRLMRVRGAMARYISHKYTRGGNTLIVYLVDPEIERRLADPTPLTAVDQSTLLHAFHAELGSLPPTAQTPVVLTTMDLRLRLRRELAATFPHLGVLSYQELSPDLNIQPIARISYD